jgi:uncharacterized protein YjbI with pentapeptide repeats
VNLHGAKLFGAVLTGSDLSEADLYNEHCIEGLLEETNLREADLTNIGLYCADLRGLMLPQSNWQSFLS